MCWLVAGCGAAPANTEPVLYGLDVLERERFSHLRGARVGLISNHTTLNRRGISGIDLLAAAQNLELVALFSPEHGLHGVADEKVGDAVHEPSGLPVHSLYGETRKPSAASLRGLDTLVFDIQDIGCRFYTYVSTMGLAMEAAAEHGLRFVVLDRPNPIGGAAVAGPVLDAGRESFVGYHPIAVRHGMTVGELARMFATERGLDLELEVVRVQNWTRDQLHDETGLYWTSPSPNMRNLTQALLYPGVGLLEFTNLSVGRGTDTPFERIGAPWIDGGSLARELNGAGLRGVHFTPVRFTPRSSKFAGEACEGVHITVTERAQLEPLSLGMHLAWALLRLYPEVWETRRYDRLLGDEVTYRAILAGQPPDEVERRWRDELADFLVRRARYLLY